MTKWTAVTPRWKEKHFVVTKIVEPDVEGGRIESVELEAVYIKRTLVIPWHDLQKRAKWRQGWLRE